MDYCTTQVHYEELRSVVRTADAEVVEKGGARHSWNVVPRYDESSKWIVLLDTEELGELENREAAEAVPRAHAAAKEKNAALSDLLKDKAPAKLVLFHITIVLTWKMPDGSFRMLMQDHATHTLVLDELPGAKPSQNKTSAVPAQVIQK